MTIEMELIKAGKPIAEAKKALIALHGRGSTAQNILSVTARLKLDNDFAIWAPQATDHTWYPLSFLAPIERNQPDLDHSLNGLKAVMDEIEATGIESKHIYILGFSQGACLALEYAARYARPYGGVIAFTGGLIGDRIYVEHYQGKFYDTSIFLGSSDRDPHVPLYRVQESMNILKSMGANVIEKIYPGISHTISEEEIAIVIALIF